MAMRQKHLPGRFDQVDDVQLQIIKFKLIEFHDYLLTTFKPAPARDVFGNIKVFIIASDYFAM
jgi:hypothetical protein